MSYIHLLNEKNTFIVFSFSKRKTGTLRNLNSRGQQMFAFFVFQPSQHCLMLESYWLHMREKKKKERRDECYNGKLDSKRQVASRTMRVVFLSSFLKDPKLFM